MLKQTLSKRYVQIDRASEGSEANGGSVYQHWRKTGAFYHLPNLSGLSYVVE